MLSKLISVDIRAYRVQLKWMVPIYGLLLLSAFGLRGFNIPVVGGFAYALALIATFLFVPTALVFALVHYYRHLYGNQGYLTHTLPVSPSQRYQAKLISGFALYVIATLSTLFGLFILMLARGLSQGIGFGRISGFFNDLRKFLAFFEINQMVAIVLALVMWLFIYLSFFAIYSLCITVGTGRRFARFGAGGPFIVYLLTYLVNQIVGVASFLFIPLSLRVAVDSAGVHYRIVNELAFRQFLEEGFKGQNMSFKEMIQLGGGHVDIGLGSVLIGIAFIIFSYFFTKRQMAKVNLK